jgi:hypothetical protein
MSRRGRIATDTLTRRLVDLARQGVRPRCGNLVDHALWTSDAEQMFACWKSVVLGGSLWNIVNSEVLLRLFVVVALLGGLSPLQPPVDLVGGRVPPLEHPVLVAR